MRQKTLASNVLWLGLATMLSMGASVAYGLLVARTLGPLDFGRFALVVGIGSWLISLAQGAGSTALMVLAAEKPEGASLLFWPGIVIHVLVGVGSLCISSIVVWMLSSDSQLLFPTLLYSLATLAALVTSVPVSIYRGLNRMSWGMGVAVAGLLTSVLMIVVKKLGLGITATIAANTISQATVGAILLCLAISSLRIRALHLDSYVVRRLLSASGALWAVTIVQASHWRVGLVMVQIFAGASSLGIYSAAAKLIENLRTVPWFLLMAILPAFVQAGQSDTERLRTLISYALRYILLIVFPVYCMLAILSPQIIRWLYTSDFAPSASVLRTSAAGLFPLFIHWVFLNALVALRKERQLVVCYTVSIIVEVILDLSVVPVWNAEGAALGNVIGETVAALLSGWYVAHSVGMFDHRIVGRVLVPGLAAVALVLVPVSPVNRLPWAGIVILVYVSLAFLSKAITVSDVRNLVLRSSAVPST